MNERNSRINELKDPSPSPPSSPSFSPSSSSSFIARSICHLLKRCIASDLSSRLFYLSPSLESEKIYARENRLVYLSWPSLIISILCSLFSLHPSLHPSPIFSWPQLRPPLNHQICSIRPYLSTFRVFELFNISISSSFRSRN